MSDQKNTSSVSKSNTVNTALKHADIISQLTLEEKASLCSGKDMWHFKGIERLSLPEIMVTDGPHGLRKQSQEGMNISESEKATCFPLAVSTASSWDKDAAFLLGKTLGEEAVCEDVGVVLGPGVNIKRNPLCGRNFEYFSEDPVLAGNMASALIKGIQSTGAGACIKHYCANNQENYRMSISSEVDERTLRELYLLPFEIAVKDAKPQTVMCSYNKVNGVYASENKRILTDILRDEWGFEGLVMSDWGAVNDRVEGVKAGLDVEMPSSGGINDKKLVQAVKDGVLDEHILDVTADRVIDLILTRVKGGGTYNVDEHNDIARQIAEKCAVLLKNDGMLPLDKSEKILIIGQLATKPRYQGAGSSYINAHKVTSLVDAMGDMSLRYAYEPGYYIAGKGIDGKLIEDACAAASKYDKVVIMAGLTPKYEAEGFDRKNISLPPEQDALISRVASVNPNVTVVLSAGSVVAMPWINKVNAVLHMNLAGQASGAACVNLLYGIVNPSGKTAETYPAKYEDVPSAPYFPGKRYTVEYREGLMVGYRYFATTGIPVLFPFGYGLSYTTYEYSDIALSSDSIGEKEGIDVSFTVTNTGTRDGEEIAQVYVTDNDSPVYKPVIELKGFEKIALKAGESKRITVKLDARAFTYYNTLEQDWRTHSGRFTIKVGGASNNLPLQADVTVKAKKYNYPINGTWYTTPSPAPVSDEDFTALLGREITPEPPVPVKGNFTPDESLGDMAATCGLARFVIKLARFFIRAQMHAPKDDPNFLMIYEIMLTSPMRALSFSSQGMFNEKMVDGLVMMMNGKFFRGLGRLLKSIGK